MRSPRLATIPLLVLSLAAGAQDPRPPVLEFHAEVGEGPLLFYSVLGDGYVLDVESGGEPQLVARGYTPKVVARVGPKTIVGEGRYDSRLFLADLERGEVQVLATTSVDLLDVDGSRFFYLEHHWDRFGGYEVEKSSEPGEVRVKSYGRASALLYTMDAHEDEAPTLLCADRIERVLAIDADSIWAVVEGTPRELWRLAKDPEDPGERIIEFSDDWVTPETVVDFSPGHRYLALNVMHRERFLSTRDLSVVDLEQGSIVFEEKRIPCGSSLGSSRIGARPLQFRWKDGETLEIVVWRRQGSVPGIDDSGEVATRFTLPSGESSSIPATDESLVFHGRVSFGFPDDERRRQGLFDLEWGKVWFTGEEDVAGSVFNEEDKFSGQLCLSPDGRWVAYASPLYRGTLNLLDGKTKTKLELAAGGCEEFVWVDAWSLPDVLVTIDGRQVLEKNLGSHVEVTGILRDGRFGPILDVDGAEVYLGPERAHPASLYGRKVRARGKLFRRAYPSPLETFTYPIWGGHSDTYLVLEESRIIPPEGWVDLELLRQRAEESSSGVGPGYRKIRNRKLPDRPGVLPGAEVWQSARVEWSPVQPSGSSWVVELHGRLLWQDTLGRWKPVDWFQDVRVLCAKNPGDRLDWSSGHSSDDTFWHETTLSRNGTFSIALISGKLRLCPGALRTFQVGLVPGRLEGGRVTFLDAEPVLPGSVAELGIRGPELLSETLMRINAAPGVNAATFQIDALVRAVNHLHGLGKERALDSLEEFIERAEDHGYSSSWIPRDPSRIDTADDNCVFLIVRLLFEPAGDPAAPSEARPLYPEVGLGQAQPVTSREAQARWPRFPLAVLDDLPLLIVSDYAIGGIRQKPIEHVRWARNHGKLREEPLRPSTDPVAAVEQVLGRLVDPTRGDSLNRQFEHLLRRQMRATIGDLVAPGRRRARGRDLDSWWAAAQKLSEEGKILWDAKRQRFVLEDR